MTDPPRHVTDSARQARTMRVPDGTVADISYDSVLDDTEPAATERRITFSTEDMEVAVIVRPVAEFLELVIEVHPKMAATVRAFDDGGPRQLDSSGAARLKVKRGLTSLVVEPITFGAAVVQTAWVSL
jgi:hypothetical protein